MNSEEMAAIKQQFKAADAQNQKVSKDKKAAEIRALEAYVQELEDNVFAPLFNHRKRKLTTTTTQGWFL